MSDMTKAQLVKTITYLRFDVSKKDREIRQLHRRCERLKRHLGKAVLQK
jgi:hypothetical protein